MTVKKEAPAAQAGAPGREDRYATAAGNPSIPSRKAKRHARGTVYTVTNGTSETFTIVVSGRDRWALTELHKAGRKGCTPIDNPAPRWAAYVHNLRALGVNIETLHEPHEGPYPGHHGRYVLRSTVTEGAKGGAA